MSYSEQANIVTVSIITETGCDLSEGEYNAYIVKSRYPIYFSSDAGDSDCDLIKTCIEDHILEIDFKGKLIVELELVETSELEDVFVNKYFVIPDKYLKRRDAVNV